MIELFHRRTLRLGAMVVLALITVPLPAVGQPAEAEEAPATSPTVSERINSVFEPIVEQMERVLFWDPFAAVGLYDPVIRDDEGAPVLDEEGEPRIMRVPFVVVWLVVAALFFTIRMRFINFRGFIHAVALILGKYNNPKSKGEVTHFQALRPRRCRRRWGWATSPGWRSRCRSGGPGATFWMIIAGLLWDGDQVHRVHAGGEVPQGRRRRHGLRAGRCTTSARG